MTTRTPQDYARPMFWVRLRSDGGYEGPIHDDSIEEVRKRSGAWTPLYAAPQSGWLPIESAPKDFVTVFDGWSGERVPDVTWARPEGSDKGVYDWCTSEYVPNWGYRMERVRGLTHWMPKPPPPPSTKGEPT